VLQKVIVAMIEFHHVVVCPVHGAGKYIVFSDAECISIEVIAILHRSIVQIFERIGGMRGVIPIRIIIAVLVDGGQKLKESEKQHVFAFPYAFIKQSKKQAII
jgi:hypothetical protein